MPDSPRFMITEFLDLVLHVDKHLEAARNAHRFHDLILIANPRLVGAWRKGLHAQTLHHVKHTIEHDLAAAQVREIEGYVQNLVRL